MAFGKLYTYLNRVRLKNLPQRKLKYLSAFVIWYSASLYRNGKDINRFFFKLPASSEQCVPYIYGMIFYRTISWVFAAYDVFYKLKFVSIFKNSVIKIGNTCTLVHVKSLNC